MSRRFIKSYETSFQAMVKDDLRALVPEFDEETFTVEMSSEEAGIAKIFSSALGVGLDQYISKVMEAELSRMINIKKRRATLDDMNEFYSEVIVAEPKAVIELKGLVANYLPIALPQLQNEGLLKHARSRLGLRFNNYKAYKLANFDGKPTVEILFYLDHASSSRYRNAWLGIHGAPLKYLSFNSIKGLCEYLQQVSIFANLCDMRFMDVGPRGLRYER